MADIVEKKESRLVDRVLKALGGIGEFIRPIIRLFLSQTGNILANIAINAVAQVAMDNAILTNDDRRKEAFNRIKEQLVSQGITLGTSVINTALEIALQRLKASEK